jgi:octaprenyl-diphosphate synthase
MQSTRETALDWAGTARRALVSLPADPLHDMLSDLADYVVERIA